MKMLLVMVVGTGVCLGQEASGPVAEPAVSTSTQMVEFSFVPREGVGTGYRIQLDGSGGGFYQVTGQELRTPIRVTAAVREQLNAGREKAAAGHCETKEKHLAQTGRKSIGYGGADVAACNFNYSDDEDLNKTVALFQSLAATMDFGERLKHEHRFDRLGLDAEMIALEQAAKEGQALELQNIAGVLQSIADDERVMDRVRRKAARMVAESGAAAAPAK